MLLSRKIRAYFTSPKLFNHLTKAFMQKQTKTKQKSWMLEKEGGEGERSNDDEKKKKKNLPLKEHVVIIWYVSSAT